MTDWATGIYEGEGYLRKASPKGYELSIKMTDKDVLEKVKQAWGVGRVRQAWSPPQYQDIFIYEVTKKKDIKNIAVAMLPLLSQRRAYHVLNWLDSIELS